MTDEGRSVTLGLGPDPYVPDSPEGEVRLETVTSRARGQDVDLFIAVPAGHGNGGQGDLRGFGTGWGGWRVQRPSAMVTECIPTVHWP